VFSAPPPGEKVSRQPKKFLGGGVGVAWDGLVSHRLAAGMEAILSETTFFFIWRVSPFL